MPAISIGGHYYRVSEWSKDRPGLPLVPAVDKAIWRKHNLYEDIIETTEALAGVVELDCAKESIPQNGIGNWTVSDFKGVQRDEEAYKPFALNAHKVKNHCVGLISYDDFQAVKFYCEKEKASAKLDVVAAVADLKTAMAEKPLGLALKEGVAVEGLGGVLTRTRLAECFAKVCPVPVPKICEKEIEALYDVAIEEREVPLKPVEETVDLYAECRDQKVPGWSPTNCYVGTVKDTYAGGGQTKRLGYDDGTTAYTKLGQSITASAAFTGACVLLQVGMVGTPGGSVIVEVKTGATGGAGTVLATYEVAGAECASGSTIVRAWGGSTWAIGNGDLYHIEVTTTGTCDASNYYFLGCNTTGAYAGGISLGYTGGAWGSIAGCDFAFAVTDNADGGKFVQRADGNQSDWATIKGAAVHTSDTYTVTMGATLTRDANVTCLQGRQGDTIGSAVGVPAYVVQIALYRYGFEVVNAGVTVTWAGNATATNSGRILSPTSGDTSSKTSRVTYLGSAGSHCRETNDGDAYSTSKGWTINWGFGAIQGTYCDFAYPYASTATVTWFTSFVATSSRVDISEIVLSHCTITGAASLNAAGPFPFYSQMTSAPDIGIRWENWTVNAGYNGGNISSYFGGNVPTNATTGFYFRWAGLKLSRAAGATGGTASLQINAGTPSTYIDQDGVRYTDTRFSEATPATFAAADAGIGGQVDFTVSNISDIAAGDYIVVYNSSNVEIGRCTRAAYEAALYDKPANRLRLAGFVNATLYAGMYCKYTRDGILFGAASGTASATPTGGVTPPTFAGITSLVDNADGTLTAAWAAPTGTAEDHFEIHVKAGAFGGTDLDDRTYLAVAADADILTQRICNLANGAKLAAGTTYYVCVRAANLGGPDTNTAALSCAVTNPNAVNGPHDNITPVAPVALGATETTIYTCPATKRAAVRVTVANIDSSGRTATLYKVLAGDTAADDTTITKTVPLAIAGTDGDSWVDIVRTLGPGDKITGLCSSASKVTAMAEVIERTIE